jgi:hypothetical protein
MKPFIALLFSLTLIADPLRVRLVTGGHAHDPEFYTAFTGDPNLAVTVEPHPRAYQGGTAKLDVLVLYDMIKVSDPKTRDWLTKWVQSGKGLVVLHHAICSFED